MWWSWCFLGGLLPWKGSSQRSFLAWWRRQPFLQNLLVLHFCLFFLTPNRSDNKTLRLHEQNQVYIQGVFRVKPAALVVTCYIEDTDHSLPLCLPLGYIDFLETEDSTVPDGVVRSSPYDEVEWRAVPPLLHKYDHWISHPDLFNVFRNNSGLRY